jgi:HAD superfamily hydrolase (TIGR01549 family)
MRGRPPAAVFFDVDFTLIYPGPTFQPDGYARFCERYGIAIDSSRFADGVKHASEVLSQGDDADLSYDPEIFIEFTRVLIRAMGGDGPRLTECAWDVYNEWAASHHFELYDDVPEVLRALHDEGVTLGLISNTHRPLDAFSEHFSLSDLISVALSSSEHGFMKPHRSIFQAALERAGVRSPAEAIMVGDSLEHDIAGARSAGMRGVLVSRSAHVVDAPVDVPVIRSLRELPAIIGIDVRF